MKTFPRETTGTVQSQPAKGLFGQSSVCFGQERWRKRHGKTTTTTTTTKSEKNKKYRVARNFCVSYFVRILRFFFSHDPQKYVDTKILSTQIYSTGKIIMQTAHVESCFVEKQNSRDVHQVVP